MYFRHYLQKNRPENTSEDPEICLPLCFINRFIGRMFGNINLQNVFTTISQQLADIIFKPVKSSLMYFSCRLAVDLYPGVGHRSVKNNIHSFTFPTGGNTK